MNFYTSSLDATHAVIILNQFFNYHPQCLFSYIAMLMIGEVNLIIVWAHIFCSSEWEQPQTDVWNLPSSSANYKHSLLSSRTFMNAFGGKSHLIGNCVSCWVSASYHSAPVPADTSIALPYTTCGHPLHEEYAYWAAFTVTTSHCNELNIALNNLGIVRASTVSTILLHTSLQAKLRVVTTRLSGPPLKASPLISHRLYLSYALTLVWI